ncbi:hypothetical protein GC093_18100 [Paenibacillus sp. LMG 31456]|uniref:Lipoprotein n=1 Tax=Paenibacillus foliorum TaxID=2654974 RepID=A0A972K3N6_9BACL|nr:hypothetical protein [Paenibacillus foliorum]NOU95122.1 hypothetical protein [Paenibacillus foliorum]
MSKRIYGIAAIIAGLLVITGCYDQTKPSELSQVPVNESKAKVEPVAPATVTDPQAALKQPDASPPVSTDKSADNVKPADASKTPPPTEASKQKEAVAQLQDEQKKAGKTEDSNTGNMAEVPSEGSQPTKQEDKKEDNAAITVETIKGKYNGQLLQQKDYYVGKLQSQLNQAIEAKKSGQSNTDIFNSYSQKAGALQEESQAKLNQLLLQMKNELLEQNLPTDSVNEFRATFYTEVDRVRKSFTDQAQGQFAK